VRRPASASGGGREYIEKLSREINEALKLADVR
jgi:hypothetical protein